VRGNIFTKAEVCTAINLPVMLHFTVELCEAWCIGIVHHT